MEVPRINSDSSRIQISPIERIPESTRVDLYRQEEPNETMDIENQRIELDRQLLLVDQMQTKLVAERVESEREKSKWHASNNTVTTTSQKLTYRFTVKEVEALIPEFNPNLEEAVSIQHWIRRIDQLKEVHQWSDLMVLIAVGGRLKAEQNYGWMPETTFIQNGNTLRWISKQFSRKLMIRRISTIRW